MQDLYPIESEGKRAEQLTQARSMGKAVFESDRGQGNIWEAAQTGRQSDRANRKQHAKRLQNAKYACNYGIIRCFIDSLGVADIDWTEELSVNKGNEVVEALICVESRTFRRAAGSTHDLHTPTYTNIHQYTPTHTNT